MGILTFNKYKCLEGHETIRQRLYFQPSPRFIKCEHCILCAEIQFKNEFLRNEERVRHIRHAGESIEEGDIEKAGKWLKELP